MASARPQGHAVDESAVVVAYNEFDPYGNPVEIGSEPYGYTGEWWGSYIELLHLRARWYSPYLNQFISPDPIIPDYFNPQSLNRYSYVNNNPINYTDPSGYTINPPLFQFEFCLFGEDPETGKCNPGPLPGLANVSTLTPVIEPKQAAVYLTLLLGYCAIELGDPLIGHIFDTFPEIPPFELPGFDLESPSYPFIYIPISNPDISSFELPPFPIPEPSPGLQIFDPVGPGIDLTNIFVANNPFFEEVFYNGRPVSGQDRQPARNRMVIEDLAFEYPEINPWVWKKVEQIFEYEGELYDLHWFEARGIVERGKSDSP